MLTFCHERAAAHRGLCEMPRIYASLTKFRLSDICDRNATEVTQRVADITLSLDAYTELDAKLCQMDARVHPDVQSGTGLSGDQ